MSSSPSTLLKSHYTAYITTLNSPSRLLSLDLTPYVHDNLTYNSKPLTRSQYESLILDDIAKIPDLKFDVKILVAEASTTANAPVDDDERDVKMENVSGTIAAVIIFPSVTPEREFMGQEPTGRSVTFSEHVFYRFEDGRIREVTSLIDGDGFRRGVTG